MSTKLKSRHNPDGSGGSSFFVTLSAPSVSQAECGVIKASGDSAVKASRR